MYSARLTILAGTASALVLAAAVTASVSSANAQQAEVFQAMPEPTMMPRPSARIIQTPESVTKPSYPGRSEERIRNSAPPAVVQQQPRRKIDVPPFPASTPAPAPALAPAPATTRALAPAPAPAAVKPSVTAAKPKPTVSPSNAQASAIASPTIAIDETAIAAKLRELVGGKKLDRLVARKTDRDAIAAFYEKNRNFQPLWLAQGGPSERAKDAVAYLRGVDADGLDPSDYPAPSFAARGPAEAAEIELKFTAMIVAYARHALNGRVHFSRVSPNIEYKLAFEAGEVLKTIASSNDLSKTLASFNPQQPGYKALKAKLAEFRNQPADAGQTRIGSGPVLKYVRDRRGREFIMSDDRVPLLRERLGLRAHADTNYDRSLAIAVAKFQKSHGVKATGQLNSATIEEINGPSRQQRLDAILATMERWRWVPRDLGRTHVVLNIPDYHLRVYHDGEQVWMTRVVVGKPSNATPLLTETMKFITVNPTWNVPQSIIYNELLPIYETTDRQIFDRMGLKVQRERDGFIRVYQPPGERNALGQIRFNFPNKFLVYQHDTPEKHYFARDKRAYSHGCMRVQNPLKYAEVLLSYAAPRSGYNQVNIQRMFGGQEQQIDFRQQIPVHITYQTAFVDDHGKLQFRDDVYGLDSKLMSVARGPDRAVADIEIERPADPNFKPTPEQGQKLNHVAGGGVPNPFALFEQLFR